MQTAQRTRPEGPTGWLHLLQTTLKGKVDPASFYRFVGASRTVADDTQYLNLGYWRDMPASYREAADALADALARHAGLQEGDTPDPATLDVGFGFGEQDVLWARRFGLQITGINLTLLQISGAIARAGREQLASGLRFFRASATSLPFAPASFARVFALECAFHFQTRRDFFTEAYRVLRPGGVLATADIVSVEQTGPEIPGVPLVRRLAIEIGRRVWHIPAGNLYPIQRYAEELAAAGFADIAIENISADVFPGIFRQLTSTETMQRFRLWEQPLVFLCALGFELPHRLRWLDYVLVRARKPGTPD